MGYTPEFSHYHSSTLRRVTWALGKPMTKTVPPIGVITKPWSATHDGLELFFVLDRNLLVIQLPAEVERPDQRTYPANRLPCSATLLASFAAFGRSHLPCLVRRGAKGYYVNTVGRNEEEIKKYIKNQVEVDQVQDKVKKQS